LKIKTEEWVIYYQVGNLYRYHRVLSAGAPGLVGLGVNMFELIWANNKKRIAKYSLVK